MELTNEFRVDRPVDETWNVLTDVERIAPALPGAQLQEIEGDEYRGIVKVKVGLRPWVGMAFARFRYAIELPAGTADKASLKKGDRLSW
jgi:carbon monoxide dehydrogenase subunit G